MSIEGQGHFFTIFFQVLYVLCFTRPRYQVSVHRTIGPLVLFSIEKILRFNIGVAILKPTSINMKVLEIYFTNKK